MSMSVPAGVLHESKHSEGMILVMATIAPDETVTIPCQNVGTFNASIDWGDGFSDQILTYDDARLVHEYALAGDHTIRICGRFPNIYFANAGDKLKLKEIVQLGDTGLTTLYEAFWGCENLISVTGSLADLSTVTNFILAFYNCINLTTVATWNMTPSSIESIFQGCASLTTVDVSNWNVSNAISFIGVFDGCASLTDVDVSNWNTSNVISMNRMFTGCSGLTSLDVSGFDTALVTTMNRMFAGCSGLTSLDVSGFDTALVTTMDRMFAGCNGLTSLDVSGFDTTLVTNLYQFVINCSNLAALDVSGWDTSSVENMQYTFFNADLLTDLAIDNWDISAVTSFDDFMANHPGLNTARYDATLIAWDAQNPVDSLSINFGGSIFTSGGAAEAARTSLVDGDFWTIADGGGT